MDTAFRSPPQQRRGKRGFHTLAAEVRSDKPLTPSASHG